MYKALIWKEYRETRLSLAAVILSLCTILFLTLFIFKEPRYSLLITAYLAEFATLPMMLYTLMAGAEAFASEYQSKTFDFLVSRTITRSRIWLFKLVFRVSTLVIPVIILLFISKPLAGPIYPFSQFQLMLIVTAEILFLFSASFFFSIIFRRPFKAGITASIFCLGFGMLFFYFFEMFFDFTIVENYLAFAIGCAILSILILGASFVIFTKGKFSYGM